MVRKVGWRDKKVDNTTDYRYKAQAGRIDYIRVLDDCVEFLIHYIPDKNRYVNCIKNENTECPACNAGYVPEKKYVCTIIYISSKDKTGREETIGKTMVWSFGPDKYVQLRGLDEEYGSIKKYDIVVICTETQFQKVSLNINTSKKTRVSKEMVEEYKANAQLIDKFTETKSAGEVEEILNSEANNDSAYTHKVNQVKNIRGKSVDMDSEDVSDTSDAIETSEVAETVTATKTEQDPEESDELDIDAIINTELDKLKKDKKSK